jgi:hypothetical protein
MWDEADRKKSLLFTTKRIKVLVRVFEICESQIHEALLPVVGPDDMLVLYNISITLRDCQ